MSHTPGPWRVGKCGAVVCDGPIEKAPGGADHIEYYGGWLVCESITPSNARLVAAAPEMLEALKVAHEAMCLATWEVKTKSAKGDLDYAIKKALAVISKATEDAA